MKHLEKIKELLAYVVHPDYLDRLAGTAVINPSSAMTFEEAEQEYEEIQRQNQENSNAAFATVEKMIDLASSFNQAARVWWHTAPNSHLSERAFSKMIGFMSIDDEIISMTKLIMDEVVIPWGESERFLNQWNRIVIEAVSNATTLAELENLYDKAPEYSPAREKCLCEFVKIAPQDAIVEFLFSREDLSESEVNILVKGLDEKIKIK